MARYVAFLGGMNLGKRRIKMSELASLFQTAGCDDVSTFIASGNVLFTTRKRDQTKLEGELAAHLESELGYKVPTFLRTPEELAATVESNPFVNEPAHATIHVCFLHRPVTDSERTIVEGARTSTDELHPSGSEVYWLCRCRLPDSQLKWKLLSKTIGESTARNISMLRRLLAHSCLRPPRR